MTERDGRGKKNPADCMCDQGKHPHGRRKFSWKRARVGFKINNSVIAVMFATIQRSRHFEVKSDFSWLSHKMKVVIFRSTRWSNMPPSQKVRLRIWRASARRTLLLFKVCSVHLHVVSKKEAGLSEISSMISGSLARRSAVILCALTHRVDVTI